jgi:hypothetical protein
MPHIIEHPDCYEYTGPSGIPVRFAKVDPPGDSDIGPKPSEILASIRASDPEAATVVQYLPAECSLMALKDQMIEADRFDAIDKLAAGWPARVRVQWLNGQTIKANDALYQAIIAGGITADQLRVMMVEAEKAD